MRRNLSHHSRFSAAFSMVELLVVVTIMAIISFTLVPASLSLMRSYQLNTSSQTIIGQLTLARQTAMTRGAPVQVRIYQLPDYNQPEETATPSLFRGMQCFIEGDPLLTNGAYIPPLTPMTRAAFFNQPVTVLMDTNRSTLLSLTNSFIPTSPLPLYKLNYKYVSFRFKPNGQTDLPDTATGMTLVLKGDALVNGTPANFRTLEIDPRSGAVRSYQP